jgi:hypothetical protein
VRSSIDVHNHLLADDVVHELSQLPGPLRDLSDAPGVLGLPPRAFGRLDLDPVPPDRAPGLTGYLLAFVPPVALECPATLVVDEQVASQDVVYAAAGEPGVILKVRGADLIKATSAVVARITRQAN